jgi:hypothetical protein
MAGSIVETHQSHTSIKKLKIVWTSDASGDCTGTTTAYIDGVIIRAAFTPGSAGSQPTDLYDVYLYETGGTIDLLGGAGVDLSNSTAATKIPLVADKDGLLAMGPAIANLLDYVVDNAGNAKSGTIEIWYR